jgi:hypothetical protein
MSEMSPRPAHPAAVGTRDAEEFQLPLSGLFADLELGRGSVRLGDDYQHCASLAKLQLLRDWQRSLARYRELALSQFAREMAAGIPKVPQGERAALLRSTCEALRIDLPTGFDALTTQT